jgi:hypothetical protein
MAQIPLLLELSDRHLPPGLADTLPDFIDLRVACTAFGTVLRVPTREQLVATSRHLPADIVVILHHARHLDCDYVLLSADADLEHGLPTWDR